MDKRTKRDLERLENLTNTERNLLKGLYGDMFGSSAASSGGKKDDGKDTSKKLSFENKYLNKKSSGPSAADLLDQAYKKHPDPLGDAKKALKEAQDLVARTEELSQGLSESNKKKMDQLMENIGAMGDVTPTGMPQTAGQTDKDKGMPVQTATGGPAPAPEPEKPKEPEKDPMEELESLVGLTTIKEDVKELMAFVKIQKLRQDSGLKSVPVSLHLVFTGNPGTGKTTVARIIGRLYKQIGVLSQGQLVEVDRSGLVAGYVGQTALKTQEQIKKAMGGVLFIDEAYALAQKDDAFGQEAIDTVLKAMEDHRDDLEQVF